jgi:hypothetical protein
MRKIELGIILVLSIVTIFLCMYVSKESYACTSTEKASIDKKRMECIQSANNLDSLGKKSQLQKCNDAYKEEMVKCQENQDD